MLQVGTRHTLIKRFGSNALVVLHMGHYTSYRALRWFFYIRRSQCSMYVAEYWKGYNNFTSVYGDAWEYESFDSAF